MRGEDLVPLMVLLLILAPLSVAVTAFTGKVVIISNSADMPAAQELMSQLSSAGVSVVIKPASGFDEAMSSSDVTEIIILGGPDAYEGVGRISAKFLSQQDQQYLRSTPGATVVRKFTKTSGGVEKEILIMAGNTRKETKLSSEFYSASGFPGSKLATVAPSIIASEKVKLTYRMITINKASGAKNTTMIEVTYFSGTVNGVPAQGYKWTFTMKQGSVNAEMTYVNAYTSDGRYCTMAKMTYMGKEMIVQPWTCGKAQTTPAGGGNPTDVLRTRVTVGYRTVPAGTFLCLIYKTSLPQGTTTIWGSPKVPLTHLVASETDTDSTKIIMELVSIG